MINHVVLLGRLTDDLNIAKTSNDISFVRFKLAINRSFKGKDNNVETDFIDMIAWRNTAEFICKYFKKGELMAIEGSIQNNNYDDKDGNRKKSFNVMVEKVSFCGNKK